jgi:hypothetical protein
MPAGVQEQLAVLFYDKSTRAFIIYIRARIIYALDMHRSEWQAEYKVMQRWLGHLYLFLIGDYAAGTNILISRQMFPHILTR